MKNYTTQTASLKATTIDTRALNAKQIDTQKLFVGGSTLEEVILQTSPKGINNAVKISTTIGSIKNSSTVISGDYKIGLNGGILYISRVDGISGHSWQPVHISLNKKMICPEMSIHVAGHWEIFLWNGLDDWR